MLPVIFLFVCLFNGHTLLVRQFVIVVLMNFVDFRDNCTRIWKEKLVGEIWRLANRKVPDFLHKNKKDNCLKHGDF